MVRWSEVIEAQRRWKDEIARADGRGEWRQPRRPARLVMAYRRALASLGGMLVSLGCRLQSGCQAWTRAEETRFSSSLRSDSLVAENNSGPCR
jgi:hypothetical protein